MSDTEQGTSHGDDMENERSPFQGEGLTMEPELKTNKGRFGLKKRILVIAIVAAIIVCAVVVVTVVVLHRNGASSDIGWFPNGAVAADVGECSEMGRDILQHGGSAVDAAITSLLCVGVVNPQSSGLGGGMFMLVHQKSMGKTEALFARERAPLAATANMTLEKFGGKAVAVPGELSGLWEAHRRYGNLPWADLFEPVIRLAEEGFQVTAHLANALLVTEAGTKSQPNFVAKYTRPDGSWKQAGDTVYAPLMARTLRAIAENGVSEFYTGETGQRLIQDIQENGGIMTEEDLASYSAEWMEPLRFPVGPGMTVMTTPSPSGGPIVQFILNILKHYNIQSDDFKTIGEKIKVYHRFLEASKFAFALRSYLGDANTSQVMEVLTKLQSEELAREVSTQIRDNGVTYTNASGYDALANTAVQDGGTCHISVADRQGNAVSVTSSVNYYFGSHILSNRTGLVLNNEMWDFSAPASQPASTANHVGPGKMPLSAMSPVIVLNEKAEAELVAGSAGSRAIITTNAWVIVRSLFTDATLTDIIDDKRIHNQLQPINVDTYEEGFPTDVLDSLMDMGHVIKSKKFISIVQAIRRMENGWMAYSDPRKQGYAAGY